MQSTFPLPLLLRRCFLALLFRSLPSTTALSAAGCSLLLARCYVRRCAVLPQRTLKRFALIPSPASRCNLNSKPHIHTYILQKRACLCVYVFEDACWWQCGHVCLFEAAAWYFMVYCCHCGFSCNTIAYKQVAIDWQRHCCAAKRVQEQQPAGLSYHSGGISDCKPLFVIHDYESVFSCCACVFWKCSQYNCWRTTLRCGHIYWGERSILCEDATITLLYLPFYGYCI